MVNVMDPTEAIRQVLFDNWNLHGNLSRENIDFNTGAMAPSRKYPSIEVIHFESYMGVLTTDWWMQEPVVFVHVWERPRSTEKNSLAQGQNRLNRMINQIYDILGAQQLNIEDLEWAHPGREVCADQFHAIDDDTTEKDTSSAPMSRGTFYPILHHYITVRGIRWRNRTLGGIAANR
jgi:hypothetical protein